LQEKTFGSSNTSHLEYKHVNVELKPVYKLKQVHTVRTLHTIIPSHSYKSKTQCFILHLLMC